MSLTGALSSYIVKKEFDKAFEEVDFYLEEDNYNELSRINDEASSFVSRYNQSFDSLNEVMDNPYNASFAAAVAQDPLRSWRQLGYCKALSDLDYEPDF